MPKRPPGIVLRPNVVIKPQFILNDVSSNDEDEDDDILDETGEQSENEHENDNYDGNFFKKTEFQGGDFVPMEAFEDQKPQSILTETAPKKEEVVEKTEEETENEKNRRTFQDWKEKLESDDANKCTKEEYAVAKFLRFNVPIKESKFVAMGEEVKAFFAKDAVDALLDSKWAKNTTGEIQITDRKSAVNLMNIFLQKGLFHRAVKVERKKDKDKSKKKKKEDNAVEEDKKSKKEKKTKSITEGQDSESKMDDKKVEKKDEEKKEDKKEEKKKKERKLKLNMHDEQLFLDGDNIYVWIYDPIPAKTFIIGLLMVVGAVAFCLFPLWPDEMRIGVYYLSLVGASFVGFVLCLVVLKQILFCCIWVLTFGKIHFWLFPNLTEDVGVIESFKPFYNYEVKKAGDAKQKAKEAKKEMRKRREKALENDETESETQEGDGEKTEDQEFEMVSHEDITENGDKEGEEEDKDVEGDDEDLGEEDDGQDSETADNSDNSDKKKNK